MTETELYSRARKQILKTEVPVELHPGMKRWKVKCLHIPSKRIVERAFTVDAFSEDDARVLARYRVLEVQNEFELLSINRTWRGIKHAPGSPAANP